MDKLEDMMTELLANPQNKRKNTPSLQQVGGSLAPGAGAPTSP